MGRIRIRRAGFKVGIAGGPLINNIAALYDDNTAIENAMLVPGVYHTVYPGMLIHRKKRLGLCPAG